MYLVNIAIAVDIVYSKNKEMAGRDRQLHTQHSNDSQFHARELLIVISDA